MYFPYVFGRQSELLALRSASNKYLSSGQVVPVIEPVVIKPNAIVKCLEGLGKNAQQAVVITNPYQGEFKGRPEAPWQKEIDGILAKQVSVVPGFQCRPGVSLATIQAFLKKYSERNVALLYLNAGLSDVEMQSLVASQNVCYHISLQGKMTASHRKMLPKPKAVDIVDHFNKQSRNADYAGFEHFTDTHKNFGVTGTGFGDYTVIGSEIQLGGGPPGAVAIHASYRDATSGDIWVEHFVSDETDVMAGSPASKYLEAVSKLAGVGSSRKHEFGVNDALDAYFSDDLTGHYPGLGKNKERQIHHHIAVMHDVLAGKI